MLLDLSKTFKGHYDACGDILRVLLSQEGHPVVYESHHVQTQEKSLSIYEKELLVAVIHALDAWKHYLLGTPFIIPTNHQSIKYFMNQKKLSSKQMRWAKFLYNFIFILLTLHVNKIWLQMLFHINL